MPDNHTRSVLRKYATPLLIITLTLMGSGIGYVFTSTIEVEQVVRAQGVFSVQGYEQIAGITGSNDNNGAGPSKSDGAVGGGAGSNSSAGSGGSVGGSAGGGAGAGAGASGGTGGSTNTGGDGCGGCGSTSNGNGGRPEGPGTQNNSGYGSGQNSAAQTQQKVNEYASQLRSAAEAATKSISVSDVASAVNRTINAAVGGIFGGTLGAIKGAVSTPSKTTTQSIQSTINSLARSSTPKTPSVAQDIRSDASVGAKSPSVSDNSPTQKPPSNEDLRRQTGDLPPEAPPADRYDQEATRRLAQGDIAGYTKVKQMQQAAAESDLQRQMDDAAAQKTKETIARMDAEWSSRKLAGFGDVPNLGTGPSQGVTVAGGKQDVQTPNLGNNPGNAQAPGYNTPTTPTQSGQTVNTAAKGDVQTPPNTGNNPGNPNAPGYNAPATPPNVSRSPQNVTQGETNAEKAEREAIEAMAALGMDDGPAPDATQSAVRNVPGITPGVSRQLNKEDQMDARTQVDTPPTEAQIRSDVTAAQTARAQESIAQKAADARKAAEESSRALGGFGNVPQGPSAPVSQNGKTVMSKNNLNETALDNLVNKADPRVGTPADPNASNYVTPPNVTRTQPSVTADAASKAGVKADAEATVGGLGPEASRQAKKDDAATARAEQSFTAPSAEDVRDEVKQKVADTLAERLEKQALDNVVNSGGIASQEIDDISQPYRDDRAHIAEEGTGDAANQDVKVDYGIPKLGGIQSIVSAVKNYFTSGDGTVPGEQGSEVKKTTETVRGTLPDGTVVTAERDADGVLSNPTYSATDKKYANPPGEYTVPTSKIVNGEPTQITVVVGKDGDIRLKGKEVVAQPKTMEVTLVDRTEPPKTPDPKDLKTDKEQPKTTQASVDRKAAEAAAQQKAIADKVAETKVTEVKIASAKEAEQAKPQELKSDNSSQEAKSAQSQQAEKADAQEAKQGTSQELKSEDVSQDAKQAGVSQELKPDNTSQEAKSSGPSEKLNPEQADKTLEAKVEDAKQQQAAQQEGKQDRQTTETSSQDDTKNVPEDREGGGNQKDQIQTLAKFWTPEKEEIAKQAQQEAEQTFDVPPGYTGSNLGEVDDVPEGTYGGSVEYSAKELEMVVRIALAEGTNIENPDGSVNIAQLIEEIGVIKNRVLSDKFPNTVEGVILQKNQFEPVTSKKNNYMGSQYSPENNKNYEEVAHIAEGVLDGTTPLIAGVDPLGNPVLNFGNLKIIVNRKPKKEAGDDGPTASNATKSTFAGIAADQSTNNAYTITSATNPDNSHTFGTKGGPKGDIVPKYDGLTLADVPLSDVTQLPQQRAQAEAVASEEPKNPDKDAKPQDQLKPSDDSTLTMKVTLAKVVPKPVPKGPDQEGGDVEIKPTSAPPPSGDGTQNPPGGNLPPAGGGSQNPPPGGGAPTPTGDSPKSGAVNQAPVTFSLAGIRKLPAKKELISDVRMAVARVYGPGYKVRITSAGQKPRPIDPKTGKLVDCKKNTCEGRTRSNTARHDIDKETGEGLAVDVNVVGPDGASLNAEQLAPLAQDWQARKLGSTGYYGNSMLHLDYVGGEKGRALVGNEASSWDYTEKKDKNGKRIRGTGNATFARAVANGQKGIKPNYKGEDGSEAAYTIAKTDITGRKLSDIPGSGEGESLQQETVPETVARVIEVQQKVDETKKEKGEGEKPKTTVETVRESVTVVLGDALDQIDQQLKNGTLSFEQALKEVKKLEAEAGVELTPGKYDPEKNPTKYHYSVPSTQIPEESVEDKDKGKLAVAQMFNQDVEIGISVIKKGEQEKVGKLSPEEARKYQEEVLQSAFKRETVKQVVRTGDDIKDVEVSSTDDQSPKEITQTSTGNDTANAEGVGEVQDENGKTIANVSQNPDGTYTLTGEQPQTQTQPKYVAIGDKVYEIGYKDGKAVEMKPTDIKAPKQPEAPAPKDEPEKPETVPEKVEKVVSDGVKTVKKAVAKVLSWFGLGGDSSKKLPTEVGTTTSAAN